MNTSPAVTKYQPPAALHPTIKATGIKGFLLWMKADPIMSRVYAQVRPQLEQAVGSMPPGSGGLAGRRQIGALSCCFCIPYCCTGSQATPDNITAAAPSCAVQSSGIANTISNVLTTGASLALTASAIANANAVTNAQLKQAAAGRPPLNIATNGGVAATSSGTIFGLPTWLVLLGGVGIVLIASKK